MAYSFTTMIGDVWTNPLDTNDFHVPCQSASELTITLQKISDEARMLFLPFEPDDCGDEEDEESEMRFIKPTDFVLKILRNGNATIVFWADGTKTVVRYSGDEEDSDYTAFTAAFAIKCFGSNSHLKKVISKKLVSNGKPKKQKKVVAEPPKEFLIGDWVMIKSMKYLTGGFPRQITAVNRHDGTYLVEGISETWWKAEALELAEHKEQTDVGKDGGN